ncbi:MAG: hypothetical protein HOP13_03490 [Alphaproteobacteria bacterium]|nr:hypothetical protein [Alphaproteobacteria bacterium]
MVSARLAAGVSGLRMTPRRHRRMYSQQRRRALMSLSQGDLYDGGADFFNGMN